MLADLSSTTLAAAYNSSLRLRFGPYVRTWNLCVRVKAWDVLRWDRHRSRSERAPYEQQQRRSSTRLGMRVYVSNT